MTTADSTHGLPRGAYFHCAGTSGLRPAPGRRVIQQVLSGLMDCLFMALFMGLTVMVTLAWGG